MSGQYGLCDFLLLKYFQKQRVFSAHSQYKRKVKCIFLSLTKVRKSFVPIKLTTHSLCLKCCYRYTWKGRLLQANIFFYNRGCLNKLVGRKYDANSVFKQGVTSNRARLFRFSPSRGFHLLELTMFYYRKWNIYKKKRANAHNFFG